MKDNNKKIYIIIVFILILLPMALMPFFKDKNEADIEEFDKRYATTFTDVRKSDDITSTFESFFSDHLAFRSDVISTWANANYKIGVSCRQNYIVVGKDDYMFLGNQYSGKTDQFRRIFYYDANSLDIAMDKIEMMDSYFSDKDIEFLYVIAPEKEDVYPELMPDWATVADTKSYMDNFMQTVDKRDLTDKVIFLDKDVDAQQEKYGYDLYYKTDGHWSTLGAFYGYLSIMDKYNETYDESYEKVELLGYEKIPHMGYALKTTLGITSDYPDFATVLETNPQNTASKELLLGAQDWTGLTYFHNEKALNDKTLLIIRDSYSSSMIEPFCDTFSDVYVVHYNNSVLANDNLETFYNIICRYNIDITMVETVRRFVDSFFYLLPSEF